MRFPSAAKEEPIFQQSQRVAGSKICWAHTTQNSLLSCLYRSFQHLLIPASRRKCEQKHDRSSNEPNTVWNKHMHAKNSFKSSSVSLWRVFFLDSPCYNLLPWLLLRKKPPGGPHERFVYFFTRVKLELLKGHDSVLVTFMLVIREVKPKGEIFWKTFLIQQLPLNIIVASVDKKGENQFVFGGPADCFFWCFESGGHFLFDSQHFSYQTYVSL